MDVEAFCLGRRAYSSCFFDFSSFFFAFSAAHLESSFEPSMFRGVSLARGRGGGRAEDELLRALLKKPFPANGGVHSTPQSISERGLVPNHKNN